MSTAVITGASDGIGAAAARTLASRGWNVAVVGRNPAKVAKVVAEAGTGARGFTADFSRLADVRALASDLLDAYPTIDVLANNAGGLSPARGATEDGHEASFQLNHLAPFLLTNLLKERLVGSRAGVITTSSIAHLGGRIDLTDLEWHSGWSRWRSYSDVKLANVLFTHELQRRWGPEGVTAVAFHPGPVASGFAGNVGGATGWFYGSWLGRLVMHTPDQGADTLVWLAEEGPPAWEPAAYYVKRRPSKQSDRARDADLARRLWDASARLVGLPDASPA